MKQILMIVGFLFFGLASLPNLCAQDSAKDIIQQKTDRELQDIIKKSPAVIGLTVVDLTTSETVFANNEELAFPQASAIKIPILMEVFKQAHEGKFALSDEKIIDPDVLVGGTGILKNIEGDLSISIGSLSTLMIALSDNSATNILIGLVGMARVNETQQEMGAQKTKLQRKMMDIEASAKNRENIATPSDAAHILQLLYDGKFISQGISSEIIEVLKETPRSESRLATRIPERVPVAFKPGGLSGVSTEWAIILLEERPYVVVIMENYKVEEQTGQTFEKISEVLFQYFWRMGNSTRHGVYRDPALMN